MPLVLGEQAFYILHNEIFRAQLAYHFEVMQEKVVSSVETSAPPGKAERLATRAASDYIHFCTIEHVKQVLQKIIVHDVLCQELCVKPELAVVADCVCQFAVLVYVACQQELEILCGCIRLEKPFAYPTCSSKQVYECNGFLPIEKIFSFRHRRNFYVTANILQFIGFWKSTVAGEFATVALGLTLYRMT